MILLIIPLGQLSLGGISEKYLPPDNPVRQAQEEFDKTFPGFRTEPLTLVIENNDGEPVTDAQIAENLAGYADQVSPFLRFEQVRLRHNSEWLAGIALPRLIGVLAQVPASSLLQREDFRTRLEGGHGLTMAELIYPVAIAVAERLTVDQVSQSFTVYPSMTGSLAEAARRLHGTRSIIS